MSSNNGESTKAFTDPDASLPITDLSQSDVNPADAENIKGGFEVKDFSFGVENPTTIGSATGGAGAGKTTQLKTP